MTGTFTACATITTTATTTNTATPTATTTNFTTAAGACPRKGDQNLPISTMHHLSSSHKSLQPILASPLISYFQLAG